MASNLLPVSTPSGSSSLTDAELDHVAYFDWVASRDFKVLVILGFLSLAL